MTFTTASQDGSYKLHKAFKEVPEGVTTTSCKGCSYEVFVKVCKFIVPYPELKAACRPWSYNTLSSLSAERLCNLCCHLSFAMSLRELKGCNPKSALVTSEDVLDGQAKIIRAALSCTLSKALACSLVGTSTSAPWTYCIQDEHALDAHRKVLVAQQLPPSAAHAHSPG